MKKIIMIILFNFLILGITGCNNPRGIVENVRVKEVTSNIYSKEDIESAINTIIKEFADKWDGCTLEEIYYAGDKESLAHKDWADRNNAEEVIVLLSKFNVDNSGGDGSLNPESTYDGWNWILVRNKGGKWIHVDHGY